MLSRYNEFLRFLDTKLSKMFEAQADFIKCKKGCAYCCKEGEYPVSELEYVNMMFCYNELENNLKDKVNENISKLLKQSRIKMYECPFLVNNVCTIYNARGIICRTFGLISYDDKNKKRIPFCVDLNLNYANVYDKDTGILTQTSKNGVEPVAYNITRKVIRSVNMEKQFDIYFGEDKPLIEWLLEENFDFMHE